MPIQRKHFHASGLLGSDASSQAEEQHNAEHDQPRSDVKAVQANERVVGRSKKVRRNRQPPLVDQPVPFLGGTEQKETTKDNGQEPQAKECSSFAAFEKSRREVDREAARQQTNGVEDRCLKNVAGRRPRAAFSYVEEIVHHDNGENGSIPR